MVIGSLEASLDRTCGHVQQAFWWQKKTNDSELIVNHCILWRFIRDSPDTWGKCFFFWDSIVFSKLIEKSFAKSMEYSYLKPALFKRRSIKKSKTQNKIQINVWKNKNILNIDSRLFKLLLDAKCFFAFEMLGWYEFLSLISSEISPVSFLRKLLIV